MTRRYRAKYGKASSLSVDLTAIMRDILNEYGQEITDEATEVLSDVAGRGLSKVKDLSPVKTGGYADGWTLEKTTNALGSVSTIIYNKSKPQLTHLLENGHRGYINKRGIRTKSVRAMKHIKPTQEWMEAEAIRKLRREIEQ